MLLDEPQLRHRTSTALYRLARSPLLDGLVVFSHNVGTHTGPGAVGLAALQPTAEELSLLAPVG